MTKIKAHTILMSLSLAFLISFFFEATTAHAALYLWNGSATTTLATTSPYSGSISLTATSTLSQNDAVQYTLSGIISGAYGLIFNTTATTTVSAASTYSGGTMLSPNVILEASLASASPSAGPLGSTSGQVDVSGGATLVVPFLAAKNFRYSTIGSGTISFAAGTFSSGTNQLFISSSSGGFLGTTTFDTSGAYSNFLLYTSGTYNGSNSKFIITGPNTTNASGSSVVDQAALAPLVQIGSLNGNGVLVAGAVSGASGTLQIGALGLNDSFSGTIGNFSSGGFANVTKVGTGTLTLSGNPSWTGVTTVSTGTLALTGAMPSSTMFNVSFTSSSTYAQLQFPSSPPLASDTINILTTATTTTATTTLVSWSGTSPSSPSLQLNGVGVTSSVPAGNFVMTYNAANGITLAASGAPSAPTNVTTTAVSPYYVTLGWTPGSGATLTNIFNGATFVTSTTSSTYTVTGLAPDTAYTFSLVSQNAYSTSSPAVASTTTLTAVPALNSNLYFSPYVWAPFGASEKEAVSGGAYVKVGFTGTSLGVQLDLSNSGSVLNNNMLSAYIDGSSTPILKTFSTADTNGVVTFTNSLAPGNHYAVIYFSYQLNGMERWNVDATTTFANIFRLDTIVLDPNATTTALASTPIAPTSQRILMFGDSITEGYNIGSVSSPQSELGYAPQMAHQIGVDYGQVGFGGQGWITDVNPFEPTWDVASGTETYGGNSWWNYDYATTRVVSTSTISEGFKEGTPTAITMNLGYNDSHEGYLVPTSTFEGYFTKMRQVSQSTSTEIFMIIPFAMNGNPAFSSSTGFEQNYANMYAGYDQYVSANPTDYHVHLIDLGAWAGGVEYADSIDNIHPNATGSLYIGTALADILRPYFWGGMTLSTTSISTDATTTISLTGTSTLWAGNNIVTGDTSDPTMNPTTFELINNTSDASILSQNIASNTAATVTMAAGSISGSFTLYDPSSDQMVQVQVSSPSQAVSVSPVVDVAGGGVGTAIPSLPTVSSSSDETDLPSAPTTTQGIISLLASLRAQLVVLQKEANASTSGYVFTRNLTLGDKGGDVQALQEFLIAQNIGYAARALARVGATGYFGSLTQAALAEYQRSVGISPSMGYFGPITQNYLANH